MPYSAASIKEKPYNRCLKCEHIGVNCDGPNFLAMEMPRLSEWCRLRKDYLHTLDPKWTNAYIAEMTEVSKTSVDRFLSGNSDDTKISTISRILKLLVNGTWGQYPCSMAETSEKEVVYVDNPDLVAKAEAAAAQCKKLQDTLDNITAEHKADIIAAHIDDREKIDYLKERIEYMKKQMDEKDKLLHERYDFLKLKDRVITILSILLAICLIAIIAALVVDAMNPDKGFFWLANYINGATNNVFKNIL